MKKNKTILFSLIAALIATFAPFVNAKASTTKVAQPKTGLLIGLANNSGRNQQYDNPSKRSGDNFKALWIYSDAKQLVKKEKSGVLVAPNDKKFYEIRNDLYSKVLGRGGLALSNLCRMALVRRY